MKNREKYRKILIASASFCFMLAIAGYINYKYNPEREKDLGQTVYVNSNADEVKIYEETEEVYSSSDDTLASFRYDRDNMFSELSSNYSSIINNSNSSEEKISEYQEKLSELIEEKNQLQMIENVIKSKGIEDVVIIPTSSGKYNVMVKKDEIDDSLAAQIMQLIVDQMGAEPEDISIEKVEL